MNETVTYEMLVNKAKEYLKEDELAVLKKAYDYAYDYHQGKMRLSGEEEISHSLHVAYILAEIKADLETLAAALLHDVLEDNQVKESDLRKVFSSEIVSLVIGITKINRLNFAGDTEAMIDNHRKILVGLSEDVRVIIIKLADRLHNMRTLWALPEKVQKEKAKETLDILTPIAHRLGMSHIKSELEDLSLRYLKPDVYFGIVEQLNQSKKERDDNVLEMQNKVSEILNEHNIKHTIKGRAKSIYSIYKKLDKGKKMSDIYDLLALRVFVDTEQDCYQALGIIHSKFKPIPKRFKDYIAMPKTNMYQSLHTTVFGVNGNLFEIQIRTYEMDEVAENGIASHWSYKEHGSNVKASLQNAMEQKLQFFKSIMELKNEETNDEAFVNSVQEDVFKNTIYVFTPKGDVIELPYGSTPIDFAYRVHSKVGDQMVGAIVNNQIVPFDYVLQDQDIIKINTSKNSAGPSREWINMAKTSQAKNKIKGFFNRVDKEEYVKSGNELLTKEVKRRKIALNDFFTSENIDKILNEFKYSTLNDLYINIGNNKLTANQVVNVIDGASESKEEQILRKAQSNVYLKENSKNDIIVKGVGDIKVNIASCCKPLPGDKIVGYITKGYGITVHRMSCPNVSSLEERIIDVYWNAKTTNKYQSSIVIHAQAGKNILLDILTKTANFDITVQSINTISQKENFIYELTVIIADLKHLEKFMTDISSIPAIIKVERLIK